VPDNLGEIVILSIGRRKHCPNAEIVSRLNSLMLADRGLKCVPYKKSGAKTRNLRSELGPEVVLVAILTKNRKSGLFYVQYFRFHGPCEVDIGGRHLVFGPKHSCQISRS